MKLSTIIAVVLSVSVSVPAFAINRSCNAELTMNWLSSSNGPPFPTQSLDTFHATRSCGRFVPNRCRERARNSLKTCFDAAIANTGIQPVECVSNGVKNYSVGVLQTTMARKLCEEPAWRDKSYDVRLRMRTSGDKKCPGTFTSQNIMNVSTFNCPQG